ncbi:unnamed protein product (macronuclear) [Paramecium tetraurelia]|uniref:Uncharacterized protein n=1 Tax=Paramecium tetraurelia TaxID=5888 RepID=A0BUF5_PARTE|nr:uncharacterized protein GSPATT00032404001 [Paramecium tetraurelia]CAK62172.1 unnamed protein product [Paramecium tetraurelia]|eukprot:XP_001429570.1 hypothetical protein (macronuclear) [Paramecium tetraurelia strain d4-2]
MDKLQQLIQEFFNVLEQNFFLSREFNKIFVSQDNAKQIAQEKKYQELTIKLLEFILSIHKSNQHSALQDRIAQTQKLLLNYHSQINQSQKREIQPLNQNFDIPTVSNYKSNPVSPRNVQINQSKSAQNLHGLEKRQKSNQNPVQGMTKGTPNSSSSQRFFIEDIPKMGKSHVKDDQQRNYNIITGM